MPDPVLPSLPAGTRLAHYVIERPVGVGAMGAVYAAHDMALDRTVAVKVVHPSLAGDREIATRFVLEARAAARVSDEHVTHIHFVGDEGGRVFYAMELVPGTNLEDLVRANVAIPSQEGGARSR